mgnify:CR=1 FL=1
MWYKMKKQKQLNCHWYVRPRIALYTGYKCTFWGRIRWGHFSKRSLWPHQWHNFNKIGTKWKIWILSFQWYPMSICRSSGLDTTTLQSWEFFRINPKHWKMHLFPKRWKLFFGTLFSKCCHSKTDQDFFMKPIANGHKYPKFSVNESRANVS